MPFDGDSPPEFAVTAHRLRQVAHWMDRRQTPDAYRRSNTDHVGSARKRDALSERFWRRNSQIAIGCVSKHILVGSTCSDPTN
jgi:hypothetical protein